MPTFIAHLASTCEALRFWLLQAMPTQFQIISQIVHWIKPRTGHLKLNINGAVQGNPRPTGRGGILRDHADTDYHFYDIQTNTAVEATAIPDGLLLCEEHNLQNIVLESNSHILIDMLQAGSCCHLRLRNMWTDIMQCHWRIQLLHISTEQEIRWLTCSLTMRPPNV